MSSKRNPQKQDDPSDTNNPFIKFKVFADSQISSLLQSIIGLPSTLARTSNITKWPDAIEASPHQDETHVSQVKAKATQRFSDAEGKDSGAGQHRASHWVERDNLTLSNGIGSLRPPWEDSVLNSSADDVDIDEQTATNIPLFSAVKRSLFAHLHAAKAESESDDGWAPISSSSLYFSPTFYNPFCLYRSNADPLKALRKNIYRDLQLNAVLRSEYSLLPYLLFSPYSPLKLENDRTKPHQVLEPNVDYMNAFTDLMLEVQNRPMSSVPFNSRMFPEVEPERCFVYNLWAHGLLQETRKTSQPLIMVFHEDWMKRCSSSKAEPGRQAEEQNVWTELEAYERFLHRASKSRNITDVLESHFEDAGDWATTGFPSSDPFETKRQLEEVSALLRAPHGDELEEEFRRKAAKVLHSLFTRPLDSNGVSGTMEEENQMQSSRENDAAKQQTARERKIFTAHPTSAFSQTTEERAKLEDVTMKSSLTFWQDYADKNDIVSLKTTTKQTRDKDGSVQMTAEVWKRHADGRESTTTTSYKEPSVQNQEADVDGNSPNHRESHQNSVSQDSAEGDIDKRKSGWYWK